MDAQEATSDSDKSDDSEYDSDSSDSSGGLPTSIARNRPGFQAHMAPPLRVPLLNLGTPMSSMSLQASGQSWLQTSVACHSDARCSSAVLRCVRAAGLW